MSKIKFTTFQLIIESVTSGERFSTPSYNSFDGLENSFHIVLDNTYYEVIFERTDDYVWFSFDFGNPKPIDDKLTNTETGSKKDNPRENNEAELLHQLFALFSFESKVLYLSSLQKAKIFETILKEQLQQNFIVKENFKSRDYFISTLESVHEISFTDVRNLFNQDPKKRQALIDLTGTDAPQSFKISAKYPKKLNIFPFVKDLLKSKDNFELSNLVIKGSDTSGFRFVFNVDSFVQKISIQAEKNDHGKYDAKFVKEKILESISS